MNKINVISKIKKKKEENKIDNKYEKYIKMYNVGVPKPAIRNKLTSIGLNYDIFEKIISVASGNKAKSEINGYGDDEFNPWVIGATM